MVIDKESRRTVIVGAGPAGIGAGLALGERGLVLEQADEPGGLCRSMVRQGAVFDYGGHSFHTPHPEIRELVFSALEMFEQKREAWCATHGTMIPYPFQSHFEQIGKPEVIEECRQGLTMASDSRDAIDFESYLQQRFGPGIAQHFMLPYNRKLWGPDLKRLLADWAGERVAASAGTKETFSQTGGKRKPLQADTSVAYPASGGFGEIMSALARRLPDLRLGKTVVSIRPDQRELTLQDGSFLGWEQLVSTLPLNRLLKLLPNVPNELHEAAARLEVLSLALVLVVVGHPIDTPIQRVYSSESDYPAHKIALNHNSSAYLRTLSTHAIMAEVSFLPSKPLPAEGLINAVTEQLKKLGIIHSDNDVLATEVVTVPFAYPVPTHDCHTIVNQLKEWLGERRIHTLGRFGEWAYINSDEALHRGLTLGRKLASSEASG